MGGRGKKFEETDAVKAKVRNREKGETKQKCLRERGNGGGREGEREGVRERGRSLRRRPGLWQS